MVGVSDLASGVAVLSSAFTLWHTSLRAADLKSFVPPLIRYASPYQNSVFEVFEIPLTVINAGARTGTVLSVDLMVTEPRGRLSKRFYSACLGPWHREKPVFKPFAPMSLAGRASENETLLFYPRSDETVMQIVQEPGRHLFRLTLNVAEARTPDMLTRVLGGRAPGPLEFEMNLPMLDHRAFTQGSGTVVLHHPDWQASGTV